MIQQIILITDGCSNVGISPVVAAAQAKAEDIVVNVIGVIDQGEMGRVGTMEIEQIARAGQGISRIVTSRQLAQTVQMMTRKTVAHSIHQVVNQELQHIIGATSVTALPPQQRARVVQVIDELEESAALRVALLIDTSASMRPKLQAVEEAIRDLMLSLQAREGSSEISVLHFPSSSIIGSKGVASEKVDSEIEKVVNWTRDVAQLHDVFDSLTTKGTTPTGPALIQTIRHFRSEALSNGPAQALYNTDMVSGHYG